MSVDLFISYSHKDRELREELAKHLSSLRNLGIINDWFDGDIIEGTEWEKELIDHLNTAQIILLLVSADFIASKFCYNIEMTLALARHNADHARVIPIILRPTDWKGTPFAKLKALPTDGKPVSQWRTYDEAFVDIVKGIRRSIQDLQRSTSRAEGEDGTYNTHIDPNGQHDHLELDTIVQPTSALPPPANSGRTNIIGSIKGRGNVANQGETVNSTVTNNYGIPVLDHRHQAPPSPKTGVHNSSLANFQALVNELHTILDHEQLSPQEGSYPQIDSGRLVSFINMMAAMAPQSASIPAPLLADTRRLCQRLHIVSLI